MSFIAEYFHNFPNTWSKQEPAAAAEIEALKEAAIHDLPDSYFQFLRCSNGGSGALPVLPGEFQIWDCNRAIEYNTLYRPRDEREIYFAFGDSATGDLLVFGLTEKPARIFCKPLIGSFEEYAPLVANDFESFVRLMGTGVWEHSDEDHP